MRKHFFLVWLLLTVVSYKAQLCFSTGTYVVGSNPYCITKGDFNSDSFLDLVITNNSSSNFTLLFNNGSGSFLSSTNFQLNAAPLGVCSDDFNSDGNLDLAITCTSDSVKLFLGNGQGSFNSPINFLTSHGPRGVLSSDINNDGKKDLAIANYYTNSISVLLGNGNGSFSSTGTFTLGLQSSYLTIGDFNNDGNKDIASSGLGGGGGISILLGDGTGNYSSPTLIAYNGGNSMCIVSNDINNDGNLDLIVTNSNSVYTTIFLGDGSGYFNSYTNFSAGYDPYFVSCNDFNGDSKIDLAVANFGSNKISVVYGNGDGTFSLPINFISGIYPNSLISGDFNSDGKIDMAASNMVSGTVSVFLNNRPNITISLNSLNVCQGTSINITASSLTTYTWSNGLTTNTINVNPLVNQTYTVIGNDINNCSTTQTIEVIVDNTCQSVWPGDANSDGITDNLDVLELGLHFTQTGAVRTATSNVWKAYTASNWVGTITNGKNLNHSDCNGDGIINADDTLAIYNNYGLTHAFKLSNMQSTNPVLNIVPDQSLVNTGTWGTSSVYLGDATNPMSNVNGLAFTLNYDNALIETDSVYLEYTNSFINSGQNLHFRKNVFTNSVLYTATTHTNNVNANGYGKIATLHYKIKPTLTANATLIIGVTQAFLSNASGSISPITSGTASLTAIALTTQLNYFASGNLIYVYPNPTSNELHIETNNVIENTMVKLTNALGQIVLTEPINSKQQQLTTINLAKGIYILELWQRNKMIFRNKLIKE